MRTQMRTVLVLALLAVVFTTGASEALAQQQPPQQQPAPRRAPAKPAIEFSATYGSMWGGNIELINGKLRTGTGGSWGFALDVPVRPGMWLEATYNRQESSLDWDERGGGTEKLTNMTANFWHLGTIRALTPPGGAIMPYVQGSLGATYLVPEASQVTIDGSTYDIDSITKFSIAFGVGFKSYFGEAKKFGLRGSFKVISTLFNSSGGVYFGTGGAGLGISGSGIWQYEAAGGLTVKFGGR